MALHTIVQTARTSEMRMLHTYAFDSYDYRLLEVIEWGMRRQRCDALDTSATAAAVPDPDTSETLAPPILRHAIDPSDPWVGMISVTLTEPEASANAVTMCQLAIEPVATGSWIVRVAIVRDVDGDREEVIEVKQPMGPFDSVEVALQELSMREDQLLRSGHTHFLSPAGRRNFGLNPGEVPAGPPPRPGASGPCVLDLEQSEPAISFAICTALERLGSRRFGPRPSSVLLGCLTDRADGYQGMVIGSHIHSGPVRLVPAILVAVLDRELSRVSDEAFREAWAPGAESWPAQLGELTKAKLLEDPQAEFAHALAHLRRLRAFVRSAAERGLCLLVHHWAVTG